MKNNIYCSRVFILLVVVFFFSGCTTLKQSDDPTRQISSDPFRGFNKRSNAFNNGLDKIIVKPVAQAYHSTVPDPVEKSVGNFFSNLSEPFNIVNNILQGKIDGVLGSSYRFIVNSTVGVFGLFDVAKEYDVALQQEDFGQTLASWGVKPGPYLVIPFLGPTNLRDGVGRVIDTSLLYPNREITDSTKAQLGLFVLNIVDSRARLLPLDDVLDNQLNPYLFLKDAYDSNRLSDIYDGSPPERSDDDLEF